jgi:tetratricopeptide (TPR) repeat protein
VSYLDLKSAAIDIRQAVDQSRRRKSSSPFFFMVGAGISHPPIPLASAIQEHCITEALRYGKTAGPGSDTPMTGYSHWFEQAYPHPGDRQHYLRQLMESQVISPANFRLAHLILEKSITNLVVTTNFDDFLSRALTLFGRNHIVCDHPRTLERIDLSANDVQIIHIHGSYWFYDCCNLKDEISDRAKASAATSFTMLAMLDDILRLHSPLVAGYSGWEGDVFMTALQRRLSASLRTNLYWFSYSESDARNLPDWLTGHPQVRIVVPQPKPAPDRPAPSGQGSEPTTREPGANSVSSWDAPVLRAITVFDELIRTFELDAPALTKDPVTFFASHLRTSLLGDKPDEIESDVYAIRAVVDLLQRLALQKDKLLPATAKETLLEPCRNAVRQSNHRQAIELVAEISPSLLSVDEMREVFSAMVNAGPALNDNSPAQLASYDLAWSFYEKLRELGRDDSSIRKQAAMALVNKGTTLGVLNRHEEAIDVYDEVIRRFENSSEPGVPEEVAKALLRKGYRLGMLGRNDEALSVYDDVLLRFGASPEAVVREQVAKALRNKGLILGAMNRSEEAIAVYGEAVERFGNATETIVREQVAVSLRNQGYSLGLLKRNDEALKVYDDVVRRFGDAPEPAVREEVGAALINKGRTLGALERTEEAIAACDEVLHRFGNASELGLIQHAAKALRNKGYWLGVLKHHEDAIAVYEELTRRFGGVSDPTVREQVAAAMANHGYSLGVLNRTDDAIAVYDEVERRFADAPETPVRELVARARSAKKLLAAKQQPEKK